MSWGNFQHLRELSIFLTIPLFVCAELYQNPEQSIQAFGHWLSFLELVGMAFIQYGMGVILILVFWSHYILPYDERIFPFTLVLSHFLITISVVGVSAFFANIDDLQLPFNVLWFGALGSFGLNLMQVEAKWKQGLNGS